MIGAPSVDDYIASIDSWARGAGISQEKKSKIKEYSRNLMQQGLPVLYDAKHLSLFVRYKLEYIMSATNSDGGHYREFKIPKRGGGERLISEPLPSLKKIQYWINQKILSKIPASKYCYAYVEGMSIKSMARFHRKKSVIIRMDIKDCFGSTKYESVRSVFSGAGYSASVSAVLAKLTTKRGRLPQGAPTSPAILNAKLREFDNHGFQYCHDNKFVYTRYADDIYVSGDIDDVSGVVSWFAKALRREGYQLNYQKLSVMRPSSRQITCGVVVNEKISVPRKLKRKIRQECFFIRKWGLLQHSQECGEAPLSILERLVGQLSFVIWLEPNNRSGIQQRKELLDMLKEHRAFKGEF